MLEINKIHHWDCLELIKLLSDNSIDLIIADPPYDIKNTQAGGVSNLAKSMQKMNNELKDTGLNINLWIDWCKEVPRIQEKINCYIRCNKSQIPQYLNYFISLWCSFDIICWRKTNAMPTFNNKYLSDKEYCLYFRKWGYCNPESYQDARTIYEQPINITDKNHFTHPTIKPLNIIETLIRNSSKIWQLILDPFMWSGTTAIASINMKREYIWFELDEKYVKIANKRIKFNPVWLF